jgi:spore coat polysaccharide biosynthesis predicted glycosyltransferase SpsG
VTLRIAMRCDAGQVTGVGHLVRSVALAEEFRARGAEVTFLSNLDNVPWAEKQLADRGLPVQLGPTTPGELLRAVGALGADAVVVDSYELDPACGVALRGAGVPVAAIVDGDIRGQVADLYIDQNLDAELLPVVLPDGARRLAGLRYALLRDSVRQLRPAAPARAPRAEPPRVLCFFGGTDAYGAAPVLTRLLVATNAPFEAIVVAGRPQLRAELAALAPGPEQSIAVIDPTDELPRLVAEADLVISASGTSTWELLCLGAPAALVWVVDNQQLGFERVVAHGLAVGLGRLDTLATDAATGAGAVSRLRTLLTTPAQRTALAARAWAAVDGRGRERAADATLDLAG